MTTAAQPPEYAQTAPAVGIPLDRRVRPLRLRALAGLAPPRDGDLLYEFARHLFAAADSIEHAESLLARIEEHLDEYLDYLDTAPIWHATGGSASAVRRLLEELRDVLRPNVLVSGQPKAGPLD